MNLSEEDLDTMIQRVTSSLKKQFPMVDRADIYQEVWAYYLSKDFTHQNEKMLWASLRRGGAAFCSYEKAHSLGYDPEDQFYYSTGQIRELLPVVMDREAWVTAAPSDQPRTSTGQDPAHGNTRLAMICDVKASLESGSKTDKTMLWTVFGLCIPEEEYALSLGITEDALRMRVVRALQRLQKRLGGPNISREYEGTRRVMSNAQSQAVTRQQEAPE